MALSEKQKKVLAYCRNHDGKITKKEAITIIDDYYSNGAFHVGNVLGRMVKAGLLIREKPGHFTIGKGRPVPDPENQTKLF